MNAHANPDLPPAHPGLSSTTLFYTGTEDPIPGIYPVPSGWTEEAHRELFPTILDIGCGPSKAAGAIGIDRYPFEGVDIVRDLMRGLPFNDNSFDSIIAKQVLEHFAGDDLMFLVEEMYRVSISGAKWQVVVPDAASPNRYRDPDHKTRDWHEDSFMLWEVDDKGEWPIFVGPAYDRRAKLKRLGSGLTSGQDRHYAMEVVK